MNENRDRAYYRTMAKRKAAHRKYISQHVYGFDWYYDFNRYSKGKIHCSCPMCSFHGFMRNSNSVKNRSIADQRKIDSMNDQENSDLTF